MKVGLKVIIIIWDLASEKPHAQEHTRPIGLGRKKLKSVGGCPPAGAEGPRGEDQLPRRPEGRSPEGRENFVPKDRANERGRGRRREAVGRSHAPLQVQVRIQHVDVRRFTKPHGSRKLEFQ